LIGARKATISDSREPFLVTLTNIGQFRCQEPALVEYFQSISSYYFDAEPGNSFAYCRSIVMG
jgi:hypothetical protein